MTEGQVVRIPVPTVDVSKAPFLCKRTNIYAVRPCVDMNLALSLRVLGQDKTLNPPSGCGV